jgi:hypothetical protein
LKVDWTCNCVLTVCYNHPSKCKDSTLLTDGEEREEWGEGKYCLEGIFDIMKIIVITTSQKSFYNGYFSQLGALQSLTTVLLKISANRLQWFL